MDLTADGIGDSEARVLSERLRAELVLSRRFIVVERGQMESILEEMGFQLSSCVATECVVEVGRILGATHMVSGSVGRVERTFALSLRLIEVESGRIEAAAVYDGSESLTHVLRSGIAAALGALLDPGASSADQLPTGLTKAQVVRRWGMPDDTSRFAYRYGNVIAYFSGDSLTTWGRRNGDSVEPPGSEEPKERQPSRRPGQSQTALGREQRDEPLPYITVGSTEDDVIRVQGTPSNFSDWGSKYWWWYGSNYVEFSKSNRRVVGWDNTSPRVQLRVRMVPAD